MSEIQRSAIKRIDQTATVGWNDGMEESDGDEAVAEQWARDAIQDWLVENSHNPDWANDLYVAWRLHLEHRLEENPEEELDGYRIRAEAAERRSLQLLEERNELHRELTELRDSIRVEAVERTRQAWMG